MSHLNQEVRIIKFKKLSSTLELAEVVILGLEFYMVIQRREKKARDLTEIRVLEILECFGI